MAGADTLARTLRNAARDVRDAGHAAGPPAGDEVRDRAPVRTGRLRASVVNRPDGAGARVTVSVVYAPPINFGWPSRGIPAQPFASADLIEHPATEAVTHEIDAALLKVHGT